MARPKKTKEERLSELLAIRLTPTDYAELSASAIDANMTITDYARQQILNGHVVINQTRKLDPADYNQIRRLGINLMQMLHSANITGKIPPEVARLCDRIERFLAKTFDDF